MGSKPLRSCRKPGCRELVSGGYCDEHKPKREYVRGESKEWHGLYSTAAWTKKLRPRQLAQEPWCEECAKHGLRVRATVVDHITPHRGNERLFFSAENLRSLCKTCHDRKTAEERRRRK